MPRAMSRPSEPVEMASMSIERSLAPRRMIDPLPKFLSISSSACASACALFLSMLPPSTTRSSGLDILAPYGMLAFDGRLDERDSDVHVLFSSANPHSIELQRCA